MPTPRGVACHNSHVTTLVKHVKACIPVVATPAECKVVVLWEPHVSVKVLKHTAGHLSVVVVLHPLGVRQLEHVLAAINKVLFPTYVTATVQPYCKTQCLTERQVQHLFE